MCVVLVAVGCGVSTKDIEQTHQRIDSLSAQGVPDSILSEARIVLKQAETAKLVGNSQEVEKYYDSAQAQIEEAREYLKTHIEALRPVIDSMRAALEVQAKGLKGLHKKSADSMLTIIDTLMQQNRVLEAKAQADKLEVRIPKLFEQQETASEIRDKLYGSWEKSQEATCKGCTALRYDKVTFKKDSTFEMVEAMEGKTTPTVKEKWKFISDGTYRLKGDTVYMKVTQEKCPVQVYWQYRQEEGKKQWIKNEKATYDSSLKDNPKTRYMTYDHITDTYSR